MTESAGEITWGPVLCPGVGLEKHGAITGLHVGFTKISWGHPSKKDRLGENSILSVLLTEKFYGGKQGQTGPV